jgi:transketolase C-terminal domain/subunit
MSDNQIVVPPSFVELFVPAGKTRPAQPREVISQRYDLCEDMAQMLTETAREKHFSIGIAEADVLDRIHAGLAAEASLVSAEEALWVVRRLAELLYWDLPPALRPSVSRKCP